MPLAVIGRGKISFLIEDILGGKENFVFYDDAKDGLKKTDECIEQRIVVTVGHTEFRRRMFELYREREIIQVISPSAQVSFTAEVGRGAIISHGCAVHAGAKIGDGCFVYSNSVIDINVNLGNFCRLGPQIYIGENARIGDNCIINAGVQIAPNVNIGNNVHIAAGALVTRSFGDHETVVGSPARSLRGDFVRRN